MHGEDFWWSSACSTTEKENDFLECLGWQRLWGWFWTWNSSNVNSTSVLMQGIKMRSLHNLQDTTVTSAYSSTSGKENGISEQWSLNRVQGDEFTINLGTVFRFREGMSNSHMHICVSSDGTKLIPILWLEVSCSRTKKGTRLPRLIWFHRCWSSIKFGSPFQSHTRDKQPRAHQVWDCRKSINSDWILFSWSWSFRPLSLSPLSCIILWGNSVL